MLVRKCDYCGKEIVSFWRLRADYINYGTRIDGTTTLIELEMCDDCMKKLGLPKDIQYGYITTGGDKNGNKDEV